MGVIKKEIMVAGSKSQRKCEVLFDFLVVPELPYEVIAGADFFQKWKIKPDPVTEDFIIDENALEI